jgi:hypothetical protein
MAQVLGLGENLCGGLGDRDVDLVERRVGR